MKCVEYESLCYFFDDINRSASLREVNHNPRKYDLIMSKAIRDIRDLNDRRTFIINLCNFPKTRRAINNVISIACKNIISNKDCKNPNLICLSHDYHRYLTKNTCKLVLHAWAVCKTGLYQEDYIFLFIKNHDFRDASLNIKLLEKIVYLYSRFKSQDFVKYASMIFLKMGKRYLKSACDLLNNSTPSMRACLLGRDDIDDKYIISGIKALSKLKSQRNINIKIELSDLEKLGPKSRLDAMKQLLGLFDRYFVYKKEKEAYRHKYGITHESVYERHLRREAEKKGYSFPFKTIPDRDEVVKFLFPCSLKYNDAVSDLIKRYDDMIAEVNTNK